MNHSCDMCGKQVESGFANNINGKEVFVCSSACIERSLDGLFERGKPLQSWSRITGYLQSIDGWNPGKVAELHDRYRDNHYFPERSG